MAITKKTLVIYYMLIQLLILLFSIKFMSPTHFLCLLIVTHETSLVIISAVELEEDTIYNI